MLSVFFNFFILLINCVGMGRAGLICSGQCSCDVDGMFLSTSQTVGASEPTYECVYCPAGAHSIGSTGQSCEQCVEGTYAGPGSRYCTACPAGTYCPTGAAMYSLCPSGTVSATNSALCTPCAEGEYSYPGSSSCLNCTSN